MAMRVRRVRGGEAVQLDVDIELLKVVLQHDDLFCGIAN
jgi:hypothetical protein